MSRRVDAGSDSDSADRNLEIKSRRGISRAKEREGGEGRREGGRDRQILNDRLLCTEARKRIIERRRRGRRLLNLRVDEHERASTSTSARSNCQS